MLLKKVNKKHLLNKKLLFNYLKIKSLKNKKKINFFFLFLFIETFFIKLKKLAKIPFIQEYWNRMLIQTLNTTENNLIKYILKVNFKKSNIKINILKNTGCNILKSSSGILGYKNSNKQNKIAFNAIAKKIKFNLRNLQICSFSMHLLGVRSNKKNILQKFNKFLNIKLFKTYNLIPFNGCRPLKKKRKKFKKKLLLI